MDKKLDEEYGDYDSVEEILDEIENDIDVMNNIRSYVFYQRPELKKAIRESINPENKTYDEIAREIVKLNLDIPYCILWRSYQLAKVVFKKKKLWKIRTSN